MRIAHKTFEVPTRKWACRKGL